MRLTVLMGGANTERDVSLASGVTIADALRRAGHEVAGVDTAEPVTDVEGRFEATPAEEPPAVELDPPDAGELARLRAARAGRVFADGVLDACRAADGVVIMLYGDEGESGHVQAVLDWVDVPYVGPGPTACGVTFDKPLTKRVVRDAGIPTPPWGIVRAGAREEGTAAVLDALEPPWIVKPARGGSTIGTGRAGDRGALEEALDRALDPGLGHDGRVLVEEFIPGREFSIGVLGDDEVLPVLEASTDRDMFDYVAKYQQGAAEEICPAEISDAVAEQLQELSLAACREIGMGPSAFPRVDVRRTADGTCHLLEINGLSGMTTTSMYPKMARAAGMDMPKLCERLVRRALG